MSKENKPFEHANTERVGQLDHTLTRKQKLKNIGSNAIAVTLAVAAIPAIPIASIGVGLGITEAMKFTYNEACRSERVLEPKPIGCIVLDYMRSNMERQNDSPHDGGGGIIPMGRPI